jgi:hypothetical protein
VKHKVKIEKCLFQIKFKPTLAFYENLYKNQTIFDFFPHWQTDRLKVTLRDYEKKHSLTIKHDSVTYETDNFLKKNEEEVINLVSNNFNHITNKKLIDRFGHRFFCLFPISISFDELVKIINLKAFSKDFFKAINREPDDSTITITSKFKDLDFRLTVGPMKNTEVPNFIGYNIENHVDVSSNNKYSELAKLVENYPKTSLYIDLDLFNTNMNSLGEIEEFYNSSHEAYEELTNNIVSYIFAESLK